MISNFPVGSIDERSISQLPPVTGLSHKYWTHVIPHVVYSIARAAIFYLRIYTPSVTRHLSMGGILKINDLT